MTCPRCGGLLRFDDDTAVVQDAGMAPALVCLRCGHRIELTPVGELLVIDQPALGPKAVEQHIRLMAQQGANERQIARHLRCSQHLVSAVLNPSSVPSSASLGKCPSATAPTAPSGK